MKVVPVRLSFLAVALLSCSTIVRAETRPAGPVESVESFHKALSANPPHVEELWTSLPPSYQKEIRDVIAECADKVDPKIWDATFKVFGKVVKVAKEKSDFFMGSEAFAQAKQVPAAAYITERENWEAVLSFAEAIATSDLRTHAGLKKLDPEKFLATTGKHVAGDCIKLAMAMGGADAAKVKEELEHFRHGKFSLVHEEEDAATVKFEVEGKEAHDIELVKVDGKWIFAEFAKEFDKAIAEAKGSTAQIEIASQQAEQFLQIAGVIDAGLDEMLAAKTQAEFNAAGERLSQHLAGLAPNPGSIGADVPSDRAPEVSEVATDEEHEDAEHEEEDEEEEAVAK